MAKDRDMFIQDLVSSLRPARALPSPVYRALVWFLVTLLANVALMTWVQPFRPGFVAQLVEYPRLLVEVASGLLCVLALMYIIFVGIVPGERVSRALKVGMAALGGVFVFSVLIALVVPSPESSFDGARLRCSHEVLVFGGASMLLLFFLARRGYLRFSPGGATAFGLAAGLIPATLMQLACMYGPTHALDHHYGPIVLLVLLGALLVKRFES